MADGSTEKLRALASELRDQQATLSDLEERTKRASERVRTITRSELVDVMNEIDVRSFEIEANGNLPALSFDLGNHYTASIPVKWEEARRDAAFEAVPEELVQITVKAIFAKGEASVAQDLAEELVAAGYTVQLEKSVHHSTLKSWLKETFESGGPLPDLELIGASIFSEVKVKELRDD